MFENLQDFDINQLPQLLLQFQQQLTSVQEKVHQHESLLLRMEQLETENNTLRKDILTKDLVIEKLRGQLSSHPMDTTNPPLEGGNKVSDQAPPKSKDTNAKYANAAKSGAHLPDPARSAKKRVAAGRLFKSAAAKGPQGYQYVYIGRSGKILRSEIRSTFRKVGVDTGRVLDICFPASGVIGILLHTQYVEGFLDLMKKCEAEVIEGFDPLDPKHIADPKYESLSTNDRESLMYEFTNTRALQTLSFLRPLNVSGVGKYFVSAGWICDEELALAVSEAMARFEEKEPKKAKFLLNSARKRTENSNGSDMEQ